MHCKLWLQGSVDILLWIRLLLRSCRKIELSSIKASYPRKSLVKGERFMRYVWRAWVCLHIREGSRVLNPGLKKHLWSLFQQDRRCSWHRMDMGSKSDLYELLNKDFRQKLIIYSAADQRPLWWLFSNPGWLRRAAVWWNVSPRQITNSGNRHKRAGCDSKVVNLWIPKNWA